MTYNISIVRGTSNTFKISLVNEHGPYKLNSGDKLYFGVVRNSGDTNYLIEKIVVGDGENEGPYIINITPEDTIDLPLNKYFYDVGVEDTSGNFF